MASLVGGQFIFGPPSGSPAVTLGVNNGTSVSPAPVPVNFNIEVFAATSATTVTAVDAGFQAGVIDPNGTLVAPGVLTGTTLRLATGDYQLTDSVISGSGQTPALIVLGSGNQTVVGAPGDTLQGGSGTQVLIGVQQPGAETILGGGGPTTVYAGAGDSVVAGSGSAYIDGTAGKMAIGVGSGGVDTIVGTFTTNAISGTSTGADTLFGGAAAVQVQGLGKGDVVSFGNQTGDAAINAMAGNIAATLGGGAAFLYGGAGDTVNLGSVGQYVDGGAGTMKITLGSGGIDSVFGSSVAGGGDTILGGSASLNFNPQSGGGDLVDLSNSSANATINAFSFGASNTQLNSVNDTIMAGTGADSVWGGPGDRIGVGTSSTAGGTHDFEHSTTVTSAAVAFGTNDTAAGSSTAKVSVTNFNTVTDTVFYASRATSIVDATIVASATSSGGNTTITLPDGTQMTFVGGITASLIKFTS